MQFYHIALIDTVFVSWRPKNILKQPFQIPYPQMESNSSSELVKETISRFSRINETVIEESSGHLRIGLLKEVNRNK